MKSRTETGSSTSGSFAFRLCFIAESAGDLVVVLDPEYHITYASQSHAKHFDAEHFAEGRDWLGLIHPDDIGLTKIFLDSMRQSAGQEHMKLRMLTQSFFMPPNLKKLDERIAVPAFPSAIKR